MASEVAPCGVVVNLTSLCSHSLELSPFHYTIFSENGEIFMSKLSTFVKRLFAQNSTTPETKPQEKVKSTTTGYVNKNNQKNIGKTNLHGNHYNQMFYQMECQLCKVTYFANGSDIWLKKCPVCQGGKYSSTIQTEVIYTFKSIPIGREFSRSEIVSMVNKKFGRNETSIIPSDYCYNRLNNGINYETSLHLFEYTRENTYKYLGINYPYTGKIYHKPKGSIEICVGELINGKLIGGNTNTTTEHRTMLSTTQKTSVANDAHKTKREISVSLRFKILKRDNFKCCACGASPAKDPSVELHVDHIVPWSKGGESTEENLQTLCSKCNLGKSDIL